MDGIKCGDPCASHKRENRTNENSGEGSTPDEVANSNAGVVMIRIDNGD